MNGQLVLDVFDGGRLLTRGFEACGFCVVGGPELIYGQTLEGWRPPFGRFDGVVGGPPCQKHSSAAQLTGTSAVDLIPEFCAIVASARPRWFLMENVPGAPVPKIKDYATASYLLNRLSLGVAKQRRRRFTFGVHCSSQHYIDERAWSAAMSEVLPRKQWAKRWFPTHPLDPPVAGCSPMPALMAAETTCTTSRDGTREHRAAGGVYAWLKEQLQPALLATDGKSHIRSSKETTVAAGVTGWHGRALTVEVAWAAQEMPGSPPALWTEGEFLRKAGAIRLLGNGVPFDMACHVARAVSIAVLGIDTGSVVRWPEHSLLERVA